MSRMSIQSHETLQTRESTWIHTPTIFLEHIHEACLCDAKKVIVLYSQKSTTKAYFKLKTDKYKADFMNTSLEYKSIANTEYTC
jgi:hypothetical protein